MLICTNKRLNELYILQRTSLLNAIENQISVTPNARTIPQFLKFRAIIPEKEEISKVAAELLKLLRINALPVFSDFRIDTLPDGSSIVVYEILPGNAK